MKVTMQGKKKEAGRDSEEVAVVVGGGGGVGRGSVIVAGWTW